MILRNLRGTPRFFITVAGAFLGIYLLLATLFHFPARRGINHEAGLGKTLPTRHFFRGLPKFVVLLSYQRSGSSFVGDWLNINPDVFYLFEPVDSLYSAMYGTPQNLNVPSDITNNPNGSTRVLPDEELNAVSNFLHKFLHCDLDNLPTQSLMNFNFILAYQHFRAAENYTACLRESFIPTFRQCENYLTGICGSRFGEASEANQKECFRRLWLNEEVPSPADDDNEPFFTMHLSCLQKQRMFLRTQCQHLLFDACRKHPIRVIKTVRATMENMRPLLRTLPNFRVIHLVRDPRAVALSRTVSEGQVRGIYSGNDSNTIAKEAKLYCSTVVRDIKTRQRLERKYPGKIYALLYDELITNTKLHLDRVYEFLDVKPPYSVVKWLSTRDNMNSKTNKTSEQIAKQWQNVLDVQVQKEIVESCREFYQLTRYTWDL